MSYQVFKLEGYTPFWKNDTDAFPEKHIETIISETPEAKWTKTSNSVEWSYPMEQLSLICNSKDKPKYIKVLDNENNAYYFYFNTWYETVGSNINGINLRAIFNLDKYMSYWHNKLQIIKAQNPKIRHIYKFCDRILYEQDDTGVATKVEINFLKQKQFGNTDPTKNYQKLRSLIGYTYFDNLERTVKNQKVSPQYIYVNVPANPYYVNTAGNQWHLGESDTYITQTQIDNARLSSIKIYLRQPYTSDKASIDSPNKNHRYKYIVCKGSALKSYYEGKQQDDAPHYVDWRKLKLTNKLLLIPIPDKLDLEWYVHPDDVHLTNTFTSNDIIKGLSDLPVTDRINQWASLDPFGDEFIGMFECDVPPYMFWQLNTTDEFTPDQLIDDDGNKYQSVDPKTLGNNAGIALNITHIKKITNGTAFYTLPIFYIILDPNNITTIKNNLRSKFTDKLRFIVQNLDKWNVDTEPSFLNPLYYNETYYVSQNSKLSLDMSYIDYNYLPLYTTIDPIMNILVSNNVQVAVDFGDANNLENPNWDNKLSIIRSEISNNVGVLGSASANYYANNVNTGATSFKVRQAEQSMANRNLGFNIFNSMINPIGATLENAINGDFGKMISSSVKMDSAGINIANMVANNRDQQRIKNLQLRSSINNIRESSDQLLVDPYVEAGIPTYIPVNYDPNRPNFQPLFITYANDLHPWDKQELFTKILHEGYPYNNVDFFNSYDNRKYMNVLHIDYSTSGDELLNILEKQDQTLWNTNMYNNEFITWLGMGHRLYKTNTLINCTLPDNPDYVDNVENYLPEIPK